MAKNEKIKVEIVGDSTGLEKSLNSAEKKLTTFGKNVGGGLGGMSQNLGGAFGTISTGLTGIATGAGIAVSAIGGLALKTNALVKELNQLSSQSGLSVSYLQKLDKTFRDTGLGMEKLVDINTDVMDKMGDAVVSGGGEFASVIKDMGFNIQEYSQFLNQPDGGIKATLHLMDAMKRAGVSAAEQKFALEAIASDASRLGSVYNDLGSKQEVLNAISNQSVAVTDELAREYKKFDNNLADLNNTGQEFLYEFMHPVIREFNDLWDWFNKGWGDSDFMKAVEELNFKGVSPSGMSTGQLNSLGKNSNVSAAAKANDQSVIDETTKRFLESNKEQGDAAFKRMTDQMQKFEKVEKDSRDKLQKERDAAAARQRIADKKAAQERINAQKTLDAAITEMVVGTNERQLAIFDRQQKELVQKIKDSAKTLGLSQGDLNSLLLQQQLSSAATRTDMINQMIGYQDPNQQMKNNIGLLQSGALNQDQKGYLADQQASSIGSVPNTDRALARNDEELNLALQQNDLLLKGHEEYEKRKSEITAYYAERAVQIQNQESMQLLQGMENSFGQIGQGMAAAFGESSGAAEAAFAIQKGLSISMTIMKIQEALAGALATPWPMNIANYAQIAAMGMSIIGTARGASSGQFHGGVDELPSAYDNKSFLLKAGERVVQPEANKQLTAFLEEQKNSSGNYSGTGEGITIYSPLIVKGNVDDPETWNKMLQKNQNNVAQAVRSSQKRNT